MDRREILELVEMGMELTDVIRSELADYRANLNAHPSNNSKLSSLDADGLTSETRALLARDAAKNRYENLLKAGLDPEVIALQMALNAASNQKSGQEAFVTPQPIVPPPPSKTLANGYGYFPPLEFGEDKLETCSTFTGNVTAENLSEHLFHHYPIEQPPVMGLYQPAPLFHPNQDPNLPFFYNPVDDTYMGFRWDYEERSPIIPPLTRDMIARYQGLYLTTHPHHYHSPWVNRPNRLTEVFFKRPKVLSTTSNAQFNSWFEMKDPKDASQPAILILHDSLKWYIEQGYNALMCTENKQCPPEILLLNPIHLVVGARWNESPNGNNAFPLRKNFVIQENHETRRISF